MKKGRQRLREDHQHTYMMSYYNYVKKCVNVVQCMCHIFNSTYQGQSGILLAFIIIGRIYVCTCYFDL